MLVRETVEVAFQSIYANPLRATLTMLGIIIGVAAVITMLALGTGAQRAIDERISALGSQLLTVCRPWANRIPNSKIGSRQRHRPCSPAANHVLQSDHS